MFKKNITSSVFRNHCALVLGAVTLSSVFVVSPAVGADATTATNETVEINQYGDVEINEIGDGELVTGRWVKVPITVTCKYYGPLQKMVIDGSVAQSNHSILGDIIPPVEFTCSGDGKPQKFTANISLLKGDTFRKGAAQAFAQVCVFDRDWPGACGEKLAAKSVNIVLK